MWLPKLVRSIGEARVARGADAAGTAGAADVSGGKLPALLVPGTEIGGSDAPEWPCEPEVVRIPLGPVSMSWQQSMRNNLHCLPLDENFGGVPGTAVPSRDDLLCLHVSKYGKLFQHLATTATSLAIAGSANRSNQSPDSSWYTGT